MARRLDLDQWPRINPEAISRARTRAKLTQLQLAIAVGVTPGIVSRWERGDISQVDLPRLAMLADALGVRPERLTRAGQKRVR